jgi:hypothetical protein
MNVLADGSGVVVASGSRAGSLKTDVTLPVSASSHGQGDGKTQLQEA